MDSHKLERWQEAIEQWKQDHPERARQLQEQAKPLAEGLNSPEWHAFWEPTKAAISQGDEAGIRVWAEDRIGLKPDSVLRVHLSRKKLGEATPAETWDRVDVRGARLQGSTKVRDIRRRYQ